MGSRAGRSDVPRANGIIRPVTVPRPLPWLILAALLAWLPALAGCDFFITPEPEPPDPSTDGVLRCGDTERLEGYFGGQALWVDIATDQGVELITGFSDPTHAGRLATSTDDDFSRSIEIWDPVRGVRVLTGRRGAGEELIFEMVAGGSAAVGGTVQVNCITPGEICFNLGDDDGNGRPDCADLGCARDTSCSTDQGDLEQVELECGGAIVPLDPPELSAIDDQRTIYTTHPGGLDQPAHEFWGGAELVIVDAEDDGEITMSFEGQGMVCPGADQGNLVSCTNPVYVEPGLDYTFFTTQLPLYVEPLTAVWPGLSTSLDCVGD